MKRFSRCCLHAAMVSCYFTAGALWAEQAADEAVIRANAEKFVEADSRRDSRTMASMWSPEAVYTDPTTGEGVVGRDAIAKQYDYIFAGAEDAKLAVTIDSIEFVSPNVAIEKRRAKVAYSEFDPEVTEYTAVHVKRDSEWLIDRISEAEVPIPPPSNYEHLKELAWLVGTWIDEDEYATIRHECSWTKNQNFLTRSFRPAQRPSFGDLAGTRPTTRPATRPGGEGLRPGDLTRPGSGDRPGRPEGDRPFRPGDNTRPSRPDRPGGGDWVDHRPDHIGDWNQWHDWRADNHTHIHNYWHSHWSNSPDGAPTGADPTMFLQLAVSKQGIISGTYQNTATDSTEAVEGMVDKQSQRAAWTAVGKSRPLMETGIVNLTQDSAPALVHFADGTTQQWLLTRLGQPEKAASK